MCVSIVKVINGRAVPCFLNVATVPGLFCVQYEQISEQSPFFNS